MAEEILPGIEGLCWIMLVICQLWEILSILLYNDYVGVKNLVLC